jgi:hypothetical protein
MARKDLKAFDGLNLLTTEMDEIEVAHLVKAKSNLSLVCEDCGGRRFVAEGFIPVSLNILTGEHIIISHIDYKEILVNRVNKCITCGCTDFIPITESET